jgi:hypothetical protein
VRRRLIAFSLLGAWLCANGTLLDVEQVYAWGRMFAGYVRTIPIEQAAAATFDPAKPCAICQAVQQARDPSPKQAAPAPAGYLTLAYQQAEVFLDRPLERSWGKLSIVFAPVRREPVLLRPPKAALA